MISIFHYTELTVLQVSIIYIYVVSCEKKTEYDLPAKLDSKYSDYYDRPARYGQQKLASTKFFRSIYNYTNQIMPEPHSPPNYELYEARFKSKQLQMYKDLYKLSEIQKGNPSAIDKEEYNTATRYVNATDNKKPLGKVAFLNVLQMYELAPKSYETKEAFYKARIQLGKMLKDNTISLLNLSSKKKTKLKNPVENLEYETDLIEPSTKDVFVKGEPYGQYVIRMVSLGKIPLDRKTCEELYQVQLHDENPNHMFREMRLKLTTESLKKPSVKMYIDFSCITNPPLSTKPTPAFSSRSSCPRSSRPGYCN